MPHDLAGNVLQPGDIVTVDFVVEEVTPAEDFCNCKCNSAIPMLPGDHTILVWFNTKQVLKKG